MFSLSGLAQFVQSTSRRSLTQTMPSSMVRKDAEKKKVVQRTSNNLHTDGGEQTCKHVKCDSSRTATNKPSHSSLVGSQSVAARAGYSQWVGDRLLVASWLVLGDVFGFSTLVGSKCESSPAHWGPGLPYT